MQKSAIAFTLTNICREKTVLEKAHPKKCFRESLVREVLKEGLKVSTDRSFKRLRISSLSRKVSEA